MRLQSRELMDITAQFPELGSLADLADGIVLDGELVAMLEGKPNLAAIQRRVALRDRNRIELLGKKSPVAYVVFDLLYLRGESIMTKPLFERRVALEEVVREINGAPMILSEAVLTQGCDLFVSAQQLRQEGIMAKLLDGHYATGKRSGLWKKIKPRDLIQD